MEKLSNIIAKTKTLVTNIKLGPQKHGRKAHSGLTQVGTRVQPLTDTCGHCVTSYEVTSMVNLCLRKKTLDFACPVCGEHWDWEHVKEQIGPSLSQTSKLEAKVSSVVQELPDEYKKCPKCRCILRRPLDSTGQPCPFSSCPRCSQTHHFCWACLAPWFFPDEAGAGQCSNASCYVAASLLSCDTVTEGCPQLRVCPKCHALVMHTKKSGKYEVCQECMHGFCFVCLQEVSLCIRYGDQICIERKADRQRFVTKRM